MRALIFLFLIVMMLGCAEETLVDKNMLTQDGTVVLEDIRIINPENKKCK